MRHLTSTVAAAITSLLLSGTLFGQVRPSEVPPWIDREPREKTSVLIALELAEEELPGRYGVRITDLDKEVLDNIPVQLQEARDTLYVHFSNICREVLSGDLPELRTPAGIGRAIASMDQFEAQTYEIAFNDVVDSLTGEVGEALVEFKNFIAQGNKSAYYINWERYVEHRPTDASERAFAICERIVGDAK